MKDRPTILRTIFMLALIFFLTIIIAIWLVAFPIDDDKIVTTNNVLKFAINNSGYISLILVQYTSLFQSYTSTKNIKKIYANLKEISKISAHNFNIDFDFEVFKQKAWKRFLIMTIFLIIVDIAAELFFIDSLLTVIALIISFFLNFLFL